MRKIVVLSSILFACSNTKRIIFSTIIMAAAAGVALGTSCKPAGTVGHVTCCDGNYYPKHSCCNQLHAGTCDAPTGWATDENCEAEGFPDTEAYDGSGVEGTGMDGGTDGMGTAADGSGGEACGTEDVQYLCKGWVAGVYLRAGQPTNFQFSIASIGVQAEPVSFPLTLPAFAGNTSEDVDAALFPACRDLCLEEAPNYVWPADPNGIWTFNKTVCVFAYNGNAGLIPNPTQGVTNTPGLADIPGVTGPIGGGAPYIPQVPYMGPPMGDECAGSECGDWDPPAHITWSYNTGTKTHTTVIADAFMDEVYANFGRDLYGCDNGRFLQTYSGSGGSEKWIMTSLAPTEFLYRMGFRSGDYNLRIRRNVTGAPWYAMNSYTQMGTAFGDLLPYAGGSPNPDFKLEARRPKPGGYDTHFWNLSIQ